MRRAVSLALVSCAVLTAVGLRAQVGKITQQDWVTSRADAQRTSWIQGDAFISPESMSKPGFKWRWTASLGSEAERLDGVSAGVVIGNLGFGSVPLSFIASDVNRAVAVDNDSGLVYWERMFVTDRTPAVECRGRTASAPARPATTLPVIPNWRGLPERGPYTSGVGAPGEGVPAYLMSRDGRGRAAAPPAAPVPAGATQTAPPLPQVVYALSGDGRLHTLGLYSGKEVSRPVPFLPPNADASDLIALNNIVYATTMNGCGGVADGLWALDLASDAKTVRTWKSERGSPVGVPAFGSDGTVFVALSKSIVALDPKELTVKDWFARDDVEFMTTPVVFKAGEREVVAGASRDGSVVLLEAASLGGSTHETALGRSVVPSAAAGAYVPNGLATWVDPGGTRWLLVPTPTALMAMRVASIGRALAPLAAWSHSMRAPLAPTVVNGVAFVLSGGESSAVLHALDAATGRELWTSGRTITSPVRRHTLWAGIGQVHVVASDNRVYAFGFSMERD